MPKKEETWRPRSMPTLLITTAARLLSRIADTRLRELGISVSQLPVIVALKNGQRLAQKELARQTGVEQPSMAQLLARMERDGLIERTPDPKDGRSSLVSLTERARAGLPDLRRALDAGSEAVLEGFSADEVETLLRLMRRLNENLDRMLEKELAQEPVDVEA